MLTVKKQEEGVRAHGEEKFGLMLKRQIRSRYIYDDLSLIYCYLMGWRGGKGEEK